MFLYRIRRFLQAWQEEDATTRVFLAWNAANTLLAFGLLLSSFFLLTAMNAPGFQRALLLGYITVAVAWLVSIFTIGSAYERVVPDEETA